MKVKILIRLHNSQISVFADETTGVFTIDEKRLSSGASSFVQSAIELFKNWPKNIDAEIPSHLKMEYKIAYDDGKQSTFLSAKGRFPKDFYKLTNLISSFKDPLEYMANASMYKTKTEKDITKGME